MAKHWSDSKKQLAAKLWANAELNTHQIAERLGCTYHSLQLFAYRNRQILPKRGYGQMHRPNNKKIKLVAAKPVQITRYKDPVTIHKASKLWHDGYAVAAIIKTLKMGDKTFVKMRKYSPTSFPKRNKNNHVVSIDWTDKFIKRLGFNTVTELEDNLVTASFAKPGKGFYLRTTSGDGWLHMSGKTVTIQKRYRYRGTLRQALNMKKTCSFKVDIVPEDKSND